MSIVYCLPSYAQCTRAGTIISPLTLLPSVEEEQQHGVQQAVEGGSLTHPHGRQTGRPVRAGGQSRPRCVLSAGARRPPPSSHGSWRETARVGHCTVYLYFFFNLSSLKWNEYLSTWETVNFFLLQFLVLFLSLFYLWHHICALTPLRVVFAYFMWWSFIFSNICSFAELFSCSRKLTLCLQNCCSRETFILEPKRDYVTRTYGLLQRWALATIFATTRQCREAKKLPRAQLCKWRRMLSN